MDGIGPLIFVILFALGCIVPHIVIACVKSSEKRKQEAEIDRIKVEDNSPENIRVKQVLKKAKKLAELEGMEVNYNKNRQWIEFTARQFKDEDNFINASIIYYVYGIHDRLIEVYCSRTGCNARELSFMTVALRMQANEKCLNYKIFVEDYQMPAISFIAQFKPNEMAIFEYREFIVELCGATTDEQLLELVEKYGAEIPERMKAMLNNDKDTLMETLFYSIAVTIEQSNANYVKWNRYTQLNFIIHYYSLLLAGVENAGNKELVENFKSSFEKHFVYYAKQKGMGEFAAKEFLEERTEMYSFVSVLDEEDSSEIISITENYIIENMGNSYNESKKFELFSQICSLHLAVSEQAKPYFEKIALEYEMELLEDDEDDDI